MRVEHPERRLAGFWGEVDRKHNAVIRARIARGPVLDLGCGYGTLTAAITRSGDFACVGVDSDPAALSYARGSCGACRFELADAAALPFADGAFATVVMRDSLHHLADEGNWQAIAGEIVRVLHRDGRVVVLDPNVTPIVRVARRLIGHTDAVCTAEQARAIFEGLGFEVSQVAYNTVFSLPVSGGYVGVELVPRSPRLHRALIRAEEWLERALERAGLLRSLAWRYVLVADRH